VKRATAVLSLALAVLLAGCGGSSTDGDAGSGGKTDTIRVAVNNGKVTPATHREPVTKGDTVKLVVTTDTADEVHVHGVDIEKETSPGKPVTITFVAKDPGIYEVETHESGLQLLQLEVR
jgi:ABC-type glycerol-3-phosphate transport system substrate-binding protein